MVARIKIAMEDCAQPAKRYTPHMVEYQWWSKAMSQSKPAKVRQRTKSGINP